MYEIKIQVKNTIVLRTEILPERKFEMKKFISVFLTAALSLMLFVGCSGDNGKIGNGTNGTITDNNKATEATSRVESMTNNSATENATDNSTDNMLDSGSYYDYDEATNTSDNNPAQDIADGAGDIVSDAGEAVGDVASDAGEMVSDGASAIGNAVDGNNNSDNEQR